MFGFLSNYENISQDYNISGLLKGRRMETTLCCKPQIKTVFNLNLSDSCVFFLTGLPHLHKILPLEIHSFLAQSLENLMHQMKGKIAPLYLFRDDGILQTVLKKRFPPL